MTNNFDLKQFLTENKLTNNAKLINEEETNSEPKEVASNTQNEYVPLKEEEEEDEAFRVDGFYTVSNAGGYEIMLSDDGDAAKVRDAFGSDNPKTSDYLEIEYVDSEDGEMDDEGNPEMEPVIDPNGYNIPLNRVMRVRNEEIEEEYTESTDESTLSIREQKLVNIVNKALTEDTASTLKFLEKLLAKTHEESTKKLIEKEIKAAKKKLEEGYGHDNTGQHLSPEDRERAKAEAPTYSEGEVVEAPKSLPKYNSIEELMKEIEVGTDKTAHEYKMNKMKETYEALENKVNSLEEGEHAEYINPTEVKKMRKDIAALRKAEEKLRKEFEKKFTDKKGAPKKEVEKPEAAEALQEGAFDLRKFLISNRK